ncbi:single-stranded DNA-binding protein [Serratia symbiotica]|uniref:single-stranded DNA-binding protein n=1 Tax=Serratia symbiotica TaxID=138074 RepID=UPI001CF03C4A|nr:single-stranded DNA-binding protein [Serratia symbiotica]
MSGHIAVHGRLVAEPTSRTTKNDTLMAMGRLAVSLPCHSSQEGQLTMWLGVVAFGRQAEFLMRHDKGELMSVAGALQVNQWTGQDGTQQTGYQVVADSVISARTVRPGVARKPGVQGVAPPDNMPAQVSGSAAADAAQQWEVYAQGGERDELDQRPPFDDPLPQREGGQSVR